MKKLLLFLVFSVSIFSFCFAHSGRTDANGCHTNSKTGEYHCHNGGSSSSSNSSSSYTPPTTNYTPVVTRTYTDKQIKSGLVINMNCNYSNTADQKTCTTILSETKTDPVSRMLRKIDNYVVDTNATYKVSNITDGDTIGIKVGKKILKVRLLGIDTPETTKQRNGKIECFSMESKNALTKILSGQSVSMKIDKTQGLLDKYGRSLAYIFLSGNNINQMMIISGYAYEYTYDKPYAYQYNFQRMQEQAKTNKVGLRAKKTCNGVR